MKEHTRTVNEFKNMNLDKNSDVYKDTKQAIEGEIDSDIDTTQAKLDKLSSNERDIYQKRQDNKAALKSDTNQELQKINIELQVAQLDPFETKLKEFKDEFDNIVYDLDNDKDNKKARSDQRKIGSVVAKLDKKYSEVSAPINEVRGLLLAKRKLLKDNLRDVQSKIKDQLEAHDKAKADHLQMLELKFENITSCLYFNNSFIVPTSYDYKKRIGIVLGINVNASYEHLQSKADEEKQRVLNDLENLYHKSLKSENDASELKELREKQDIQDQKDRDAIIAKEAAEQAMVEAENSKKLAVENERNRIEEEAALLRREESIKAAEIEARNNTIENRNRIHNMLFQSFLDKGLSENDARLVVTIIKNSLISNITINYGY